MDQWNKRERTKVNSHLDTTKGLKIYSEEKAFSINGVGKAGHSYMHLNTRERKSNYFEIAKVVRLKVFI